MTSLNDLAAEIYGISQSKGFWDERQCEWNPNEGHQRSLGETLMLITTEVAEAMEAVRDGKLESSWSYSTNNPHVIDGCDIQYNPDGDGKTYIVSRATGNRMEATHQTWLSLGYIAKPEGLPSELADIIIRVLDLCGQRGIDIEENVRQKIRYNATREYKHGRAL